MVKKSQNDNLEEKNKWVTKSREKGDLIQKKEPPWRGEARRRNPWR